MTIAFIILVHKGPSQVGRLARRLQGPGSSLYVHVDRSATPETFRRMQSELDGVPGTSWLPRRYTHWGSFALVRAALSGLRRAFDDGADYAYLLSGQDYPIQPLERLHLFLGENAGRSFIRWYPFPCPEWPSDGLARLTRWHFQLEMPHGRVRTKLNNLLIKVFRRLQPERRVPAEIRPFGGPQWWCLHKDAIRVAVEFESRHPQAARFFRHVRIPDEAYFHTALLNSDVKDGIIDRSLTFVDWDGPPYPRVLGEPDLPALRASDAFFARKFDTVAGESVLDAIDEHLLA